MQSLAYSLQLQFAGQINLGVNIVKNAVKEIAKKAGISLQAAKKILIACSKKKRIK